MKAVPVWILAAQLLHCHARDTSCFDGGGAEVILTPGDSVNTTFPYLDFKPKYAIVYTTEGEEHIESFVLSSPTPCALQTTRAYTITLGANYPAGKSNIEFIDETSAYCVTVRVGQAVSADQTYDFEAYCFANTTCADIAGISTKTTGTTLITSTTHLAPGTGTPSSRSTRTGGSSSEFADTVTPSFTDTSSATTKTAPTGNARSDPSSHSSLESTTGSPVPSPKETTSENISPTDSEEACPCRT